MKNVTLPLILATAVIMVFPASAANLNITIDENGTGFYVSDSDNKVHLLGIVTTPYKDPGVGGLNNVLAYVLPFAGVAGDVPIIDALNGPMADLLRFNGDGTLIVYSDQDEVIAPDKDLADTGFPAALQGNKSGSQMEVGPEGNNFATWNPNLATDPGFVANFNTTYKLMSDGCVVVPQQGQVQAAATCAAVVPEPTSAILVVLGIVLFGISRWGIDRK